MRRKDAGVARPSQRDLDNTATAGTMTIMQIAKKLHARGVEALVAQKRADGWQASVRRPDGVGPHARGAADIGEAIVHLMALLDAEG